MPSDLKAHQRGRLSVALEGATNPEHVKALTLALNLMDLMEPGQVLAPHIVDALAPMEEPT